MCKAALAYNETKTEQWRREHSGYPDLFPVRGGASTRKHCERVSVHYPCIKSTEFGTVATVSSAVQDRGFSLYC